MRTLLQPELNYPVEITICRRTRTLENGMVTFEVSEENTKAIWVDLGLVSTESRDGGHEKRLAVEVHLDASFDDLVPGKDYFKKGGIYYRILRKMDMIRMSGVPMYLAVLRDDP